LIILPAQALKSNPKAHSDFLPRLLLFIFLILIFIHAGIRNQKSTLMSGYVLYNYTPSLAVANVALLLFLAATVVHIFLAIKNCTNFLTAFIIGGFLETIGYGARAVNAYQAPNYSTMPYALQSLFVLIPPSLFAASIYMILGRIIRLRATRDVF
jgi:hypothetical protein